MVAENGSSSCKTCSTKFQHISATTSWADLLSEGATGCTCNACVSVHRAACRHPSKPPWSFMAGPRCSILASIAKGMRGRLTTPTIRATSPERRGVPTGLFVFTSADTQGKLDAQWGVRRCPAPAAASRGGNGAPYPRELRLTAPLGAWCMPRPPPSPHPVMYL